MLALKTTLILPLACFLSLASDLAAQTVDEKLDCTVAACHQNVVDKSVLHPALEGGCALCHEANNGRHPEDADDEFSLISEEPDLCYQCHEEETDRKVIHPPLEGGPVQSAILPMGRAILSSC